jgi:hypothetical protein
MSLGDQELGPIVGMRAIENAARKCLTEPKVLGVYIDDALRQNYGGNVRVARPKDIVCASDQQTTQLRAPYIVVQAESSGDARRGGDRRYTASYTLAAHCVAVGGSQESCRQTADVLSAAVSACLLQRLSMQQAGTAGIGAVRWELIATSERSAGASKSYANYVAQLSIDVHGVLSDLRGRLPTLPVPDPDNTAPAPAPDNLRVIVDLPIEIADPQP